MIFFCIAHIAFRRGRHGDNDAFVGSNYAVRSERKLDRLTRINKAVGIFHSDRDFLARDLKRLACLASEIVGALGYCHGDGVRARIPRPVVRIERTTVCGERDSDCRAARIASLFQNRITDFFAVINSVFDVEIHRNGSLFDLERPFFAYSVVVVSAFNSDDAVICPGIRRGCEEPSVKLFQMFLIGIICHHHVAERRGRLTDDRLFAVRPACSEFGRQTVARLFDGEAEVRTELVVILALRHTDRHIIGRRIGGRRKELSVDRMLTFSIRIVRHRHLAERRGRLADDRLFAVRPACGKSGRQAVVRLGNDELIFFREYVIVRALRDRHNGNVSACAGRVVEPTLIRLSAAVRSKLIVCDLRLAGRRLRSGVCPCL